MRRAFLWLVALCIFLAGRCLLAEERLSAGEPLVLRHPAINKSIGNPVHCLAFLSEGSLLATGATSGVHVWETSSGKLRETLDVDERSVDALAQDPRGTYLVAGGAAGVIKVWDARTLARVATLGPTSGAVRSLAISLDGKMLASASPNPPPSKSEAPYGILLWDLSARSQLRQIEHPAPLFGSTVLGFLPDGKLVSAQDRTLRLIDVWKGTISKTIDLPELPRTIGSIALDRDGRRIATGVFEAKLRQFETRDWKEVLAWNAHDKQAPPRRGVSVVSYSQDGQYLLSGGLDGRVGVWHAATGRTLLDLDGRGDSTNGWITGVALSRDNRLLAATHFGGTATVWRMEVAK